VPTIHDVAERADVSIATVSRVLNGNTRVSEESRRRVWAAADELDYWPNGAARSLTTRCTHALGVLLPDLYGEFFSEIIRGIDQTARHHRHQVWLSSSHADSETVLTAARSMRGRIDGLIMMVPEAGSAESVESIRRRFPLVLLNPPGPVAGCASVSIANFEGALAATRHLVALGHRAIATIRGPVGNVDAEERLRGYREALREASLPLRRELELAGDFTETSGFRCAELLLRTPRPTAVFAANDSMAVGLLSALGMQGVAVPGDLALVGFDDISIARFVNPPLTTVRVDAYGLGRQAVELMLSRGEPARPVSTVHEALPAPLVVRRSCGAVPSVAAPTPSSRQPGRRPLP
jgi:LacI family transcriptional regulator